MPDYKKLYFKLFAAMADAVDAIEAEHYEEARKILIESQQEAEEEYIRDV